MTAPGPARAFLGNRLRQLRHGALDEGEEIHRQPPGRALLGAARRHHRPDQRGQHRSGVLPPDQIEAFHGLVDEVQHVAAVGVDPLGAGHEQQLGQRRRRGTTGDRGEQGALGTVAMAHGRPAPQPALQGRRVDRALERGAVAAWCLARAIGGDPPRAVEQGEAGLLLRQPGHQISQSREDGQADTPTVPMLRSEQRDLAQHRRRRLACAEQATHRLGDDQIQIVGQAVREPAAPVTHRVGMVEHGLYPDVFLADLDRTGRHVVRPQVERAAAGQIEPGVMPMAGQDAVLDRPAVEREAHMRAAVVEGGEKMHARYIITERAAVRFDVGLDDGDAGQNVPITILPYAEHQRWVATFNEQEPSSSGTAPFLTSVRGARSSSVDRPHTGPASKGKAECDSCGIYRMGYAGSWVTTV